MRLSTVVRRESEIKERILSEFSAARIFGLSLDAFHRRMRDRVWRSPDYRGLPRHAQSYLRGFEDASFSQMWHTELRFEHYSTVDHYWHDAFGACLAGEGFERLLRAQCEYQGGVDRTRFGVGEYWWRNSGPPSRHTWRKNGRYATGDSVVGNRVCPVCCPVEY